LATLVYIASGSFNLFWGGIKLSFGYMNRITEVKVKMGQLDMKGEKVSIDYVTEDYSRIVAAKRS
jgi:hypothetical protein